MKKICAVLLVLTLMISCLPIAFAGQGAAESNVSPIPTSKWVLTGGDWWNAIGQPGRADYYGTVNVTLSFDAAAGTVAYTETRVDNGKPMFTLEGTFTADETTCTVQGGGMELSAGYMIAGNSMVVTTPYGMGFFTRAEAAPAVSPIPTSKWILFGGDWWNAIGQPGMADYYATVNVTLSFDAKAGTVVYSEDRADNGRNMFSLNGTYTADETSCTVKGGGTELTANYILAGDYLTVTTPCGIGLFTRAD